jgi:hypothetical protein
MHTKVYPLRLYQFDLFVHTANENGKIDNLIDNLMEIESFNREVTFAIHLSINSVETKYFWHIENQISWSPLGHFSFLGEWFLYARTVLQ